MLRACPVGRPRATGLESSSTFPHWPRFTPTPLGRPHRASALRSDELLSLAAQASQDTPWELCDLILMTVIHTKHSVEPGNVVFAGLLLRGKCPYEIDLFFEKKQIVSEPHLTTHADQLFSRRGHVAGVP